MITPEQNKKLEEWSKYFVYKEDEYGDDVLVGLKKDTPKKILKEFKKWYTETYPKIEDEDKANEIPDA